MTFGLITEGITDQVVLNYLVAKFFENPDIDIRPVQPNYDSTDKSGHFGGWVKVLEYCKSPDMAATLEANDYTIIQIDTDVCEEYGVSTRDEHGPLSADDIVSKVKAVIRKNIGEELSAKHERKIIFAISYNSIECWLLPLYFNNNLRSKVINCCETLNQELIKEGFTIDCNNKKPAYYHKICRKIRNKTQIEDISVHNNSFIQFISTLALIN